LNSLSDSACSSDSQKVGSDPADPTIKCGNGNFVCPITPAPEHGLAHKGRVPSESIQEEQVRSFKPILRHYLKCYALKISMFVVSRGKISTSFPIFGILLSLFYP
jgi:hypothetical protein